MPATLALIVAFAPQSSGFFSPVEPLVLLLDGQSGDLAVVGESQNLAPARGCKLPTNQTGIGRRATADAACNCGAHNRRSCRSFLATARSAQGPAQRNQTAGCRKLAVRCAESSGAFLTPSPPAEKTTARQDQAGQSSTCDWAGNRYGANQPVGLAVDTIGEEEGVEASRYCSRSRSRGTKGRLACDCLYQSGSCPRTYRLNSEGSEDVSRAGQLRKGALLRMRRGRASVHYLDRAR
jgi:hypothetical protein